MEQQSVQEGFWDDVARAGKISERIARLKQQILEYNELKNKINDIQFFLKEEEFFKDVEIQKELEKEFNIKNKKDYYLGSIAPDIAKQIGETKDKSHFIINTDKDIPNLDIYTTKYKKFKKNDFELGYFIHL